MAVSHQVNAFFRSGRGALLLSILSGIFFALSLHPFDLWVVGWFAFVPLLLAAHRKEHRPLEAFGLGMVTALVCGIVLVRMAGSVEQWLTGYIPFFILALSLGTVALTANRIKTLSSTSAALFLAALGVTIELLSCFTVIPINIAICQHQNEAVLQLAALTGIWGVSFVLWFVNVAVAGALAARRFTVGWGAAVAFVFVVHVLGSILARTHCGRAVFVAAIQEMGEDREKLTRLAARHGAKLVVWSELSLGHAKPETVADLARECKVWLVVGFMEDRRPKPCNAAALISPEGKVVGIYRKVHPFGAEMRLIQPGKEVKAFETPWGKVGIQICFDTMFTDVTRKLARDGARLIVVPNFDPPVRNGALHYLHAAATPFRAVENRVSIIRADAKGLSQVVSRFGEVKEAPLYQPHVLLEHVELWLFSGTTPFSIWGDWFAYLCAAGVLAGVLGQVAGRQWGC